MLVKLRHITVNVLGQPIFGEVGSIAFCSNSNINNMLVEIKEGIKVTITP